MTARETEHAGGGVPTELIPTEHAASQSEGLRVLLSLGASRRGNLSGETAVRNGRAPTLAPEPEVAALSPAAPAPEGPARRARRAGRASTGGRHAATSRLVDRRGSRFVVFSAIGGVVFLMGLGLQAVLTGRWHVPPVLSYLIQAVTSVEASFLLNRWLTWRDRGTRFWLAFARFNAQKTVTIALNLALYAGFLRLGMNYLIANAVLTAVFTVVNYVAGDRFVFIPGGTPPAEPAAPAAPALVREHLMPGVSVVIPCRDNEGTIGAVVQSLLDQDYPRLHEVILIGSPEDPTWSAQAGIADPRLAIFELETPPGVRDANFKRDAGIRMTTGDLIALVDSDIVLPSDWMSRAVAALEDSGASCVAGGMRSVHSSFWGRYTDGTWIGAKTPRIAESYTVTSADFGKHGRKPPITANTMFTRELYDDCPIDPSWSHGSYEDYEWFWRVASAGYRIRVCWDLFGWHHHRRGLRPLAREYRRSSRGCAYFIRAHPDSPLAKRRLRQAVVLPLAAIAGAITAAAAAAAGYATAVAGLALGCAAVLAVHQVARSRSLESLAYPVAGLALGVVFTTGLVTHLLRPDSARPEASALRDIAPAPDPRRLAEDSAEVNAVMSPVTTHRYPAAGRRGRWSAHFLVLAFVAILVAGTGLRLWHLGGSPAWQWDEAVYYRVSVNVQHGVLSEHSVRGVSFEPFLYQPPFYFLMLSRWFSIIGASIYHARLLGVVLTAAMLTVMFRLLWKIHGPGAALFAIIPVVFDGWLMYIECVSYIENALILVLAAAFLLYQRALEQPSWQRFAIAGAMLGFAAVFKQTGAYAVLAVLLCWLITRRGHKGHLVLLGVFLAVVVAYVAVMIRWYDVPGHNWYINQTLVQIRRVLGLQQSGGTLTSPVKLLHLLAAQYRYFIPSVLVALTSFLTAARRLLQCYQTRSWEPARGNALLFSWMAAGVVVFGFSSLKFPQYFALILIPAYCFLWTELARWDWRPAWKSATVAAAGLAGLGSFLLTVPIFSANTLAQAQQYTAHIPASSIIVTEQSIGDLIQQPWCTVEYAVPCLHAASYAITWRTYLQSSFRQGDWAFHHLMKGAIPIKSFSGKVGTATVWKLRRT